MMKKEVVGGTEIDHKAISAPYEVPQFPIEQIEGKLKLQRQLSQR